MTILTKKFSEFIDGGDLVNSDITVGLRAGLNTKFSNPSPGPGGIVWNNVTGTTADMVSFNGYSANNASQVFLSLPTTSLFGDQILIMGFGSGGWHVIQGDGQQIIIGSIASTVGSSGYIESVNQYDSIVLQCMVDNLTWQCLGAPQGNITII